MSNKTRKRIWPVSVVAVIGMVAILAALAVTAIVPGASQAQEVPPPVAGPSNLQATATSASEIALSWNAGLGHATYELQRKEGDDEFATVAADISGSAISHTDTELTVNTTYTYRVRGVNIAGSSPWSNEATARTRTNAPMAGDAIPAQTVYIGRKVMVQSTITDVDADDTLTWAWSSDDTDTATVMMDATDGSMATVTGVAAGSATITVTATDGDGGTATQTFMVTVSEPKRASIASTSTSASATVQLTLTIPSLPMDLQGGSSIVLYLEDDFGVPDSIDRDTVYFTADGGSDADDRSTSNGRRVYATDPIAIETDDHFTADKDDYDIQVLVPDMNTSDVDQYSNFDGPKAGQTLTLVFTKAAGIKNHSEAGAHSVGYSILGPTDSVGGPMYRDAMIDGAPLMTLAKISLSDVDNSRGYELTVTGSGFNNGTSAAVHVLAHARFAVAKWWETLDCAGMKMAMMSDKDEFCFHYDLNNTNMSYMLNTSAGMRGGSAAFMALSDADKMMYSKMVFDRHLCRIIIQDGQRAGIATVGSDDKAAVTFEVTVPTFVPGNNNYLCMVDGEGRTSNTDVEDFNLEPSIRVVPSSASAGDSITVFAQDYMSGGFEELKIAGQSVYKSTNATAANAVSVTASSIGSDGSATAVFDLPGSVSGSALEGTVRIDATWGGDAEDTKITITGSQLTLSKAEALPNELITITGDGFGGDYIDVRNITMDGAALMVDSDSMHRMGAMNVVDVSNAGQFVASVVLWPETVSGSNPSLIAGTHTIKVEDNSGFSGSAVISIPEASLSVAPGVAGPRDVITITGENWPIDNVDGAAPPAVDIKISDGSRTRRYSAFADSAGRFTVEHRVSSDVAIPSTNQVRAEMGTDIVKVGSFEVLAAILNIEPAEGQPGDRITLSADGMPVYQQVDRVEIGGRSVLPVGNFSTDASGNVTVADVLIPGLDPGTYSVLLDVEDTIAIGELNVLAESAAIGAAAMLPDAVSELGDNLMAIFYFDDVGKAWSFYDPRPEFEDLNTLSELVTGQPYWILVGESAEDVLLNNRTRSLTCRGDNCWNLEVW